MSLSHKISKNQESQLNIVNKNNTELVNALKKLDVVPQKYIQSILNKLVNINDTIDELNTEMEHLLFDLDTVQLPNSNCGELLTSERECEELTDSDSAKDRQTSNKLTEECIKTFGPYVIAYMTYLQNEIRLIK